MFRLPVSTEIGCHVPEKNITEAVTRDTVSSDWLKLAALYFLTVLGQGHKVIDLQFYLIHSCRAHKSRNALAFIRFPLLISPHPRTRDPEPTSPLCCCQGVFTDRFIFRLNYPRMRLPQEADDQLQETNLTS